MSELEELLWQLRAAAEIHGPDWVQRQVSSLLQGVRQDSPPLRPASVLARRSRPPERFSPDHTRASALTREPSRDPSGPPAKQSAAASARAPGRNPHPQQRPRGALTLLSILPLLAHSGSGSHSRCFQQCSGRRCGPAKGEFLVRAPANPLPRPAALIGGMVECGEAQALRPATHVSQEAQPPGPWWGLGGLAGGISCAAQVAVALDDDVSGQSGSRDDVSPQGDPTASQQPPAVPREHGWSRERQRGSRRHAAHLHPDDGSST